jgi:NADP-dependent 3-hydroxy acid dehydrogenase YdfG
MADDSKGRVAVVTGASAGIGAASVRALREAGFEVYAGARRLDRLEALAAEIGAVSLPLDVTDGRSIERFVAETPSINLLVNNAGGALGLEPVADAVDEKWREMWETNVWGLMAMTRACLPKLVASGAGHVINIGSIAGFEVYPGGAGYTSVKHAVRAISRTLRLELLGKPVRVTEIDPGMVETEFSLVRFDGDTQRADGVYEGLTPLKAEDVADCVAWAATRPPHVNIDEMVVRPLAQAAAHAVHRESSS